MSTSQHTVWEVASALRRIVAEMDVGRTYPRLDVVPFVGIVSVQLQVSGGTERERMLAVQTMRLRLLKRFPALEGEIAIEQAADHLVLIAGGGQLRDTC